MEKAVSNTSPKNMRYERKFVYTNMLAEDIIDTEVLTNSFCFREIFHRRTVNNCYLDDNAMSFYRQNVAGDEKRDKYRLRWYGDHFSKIQQPVLEIKKKQGTVGDKLSFSFKNTEIDLSNITAPSLVEKIKKNAYNNSYSELANALELLHPSLYNSYERRYFLSDCNRFRITIDYNMKFYDVQTQRFDMAKATLPEVVLELKYATEHDGASRSLTQKLSERLSKHSKYVRGIDLMHH